MTLLVVGIADRAFEETRVLGWTLLILDPCGATGNAECLFKAE